MLASSLIAASAAIVGVVSAQQAIPAGPCATGVHVVAIGGANSTDPAAYGLLSSLSDSILAAIPGSDSVSVPYNKVNVSGNPQAVPEGNANLGSFVAQYHGACPDTKIVIIGYSAGGIIAMNGICTGIIDPSLADTTIIATVVYGDQTRISGLPYDVGTCQGQNGRLSSKRDPNGCTPFISGIQSYCDTNDPECCNGPKEDYQIHFVYPSEYDGAATQFIVNRFNELGGGAATPESSSTSAEEPTTTAAPPTTTSTQTVDPATQTEVPTTTEAPPTTTETTSEAPAETSDPAATTTAPPAFDPNSAFSLSPAKALVGAAALVAAQLL